MLNENLHDDFQSECSKLVQKSNKTIMTTQRLRSICLEIYETLNQLNSRFMFSILNYHPQIGLHVNNTF